LLAALAPRRATEVAVDDVLAALDEERDDFGAVG
jgi:hypothetical protein